MTTQTSNAPFRGALSVPFLTLEVSKGDTIVEVLLTGMLSNATKKLKDGTIVPKAQTWKFEGSIDVPLTSGHAGDVLKSLAVTLRGESLKQGSLRTGDVKNEGTAKQRGGNLFVPFSLNLDIEGHAYWAQVNCVAYPREILDDEGVVVTDEDGKVQTTPVIAINAQVVVRPVPKAKAPRVPKATANVTF